MNITYIARLDDSLQECSWMRFVDTSPSGKASISPLSQLLDEAEGQRLLLVLPATLYTLLPAEIPAKSEKQLAAAIPFALEEELAEDVDTLHFRIIQRGNGDRLVVATIKRELIDSLHTQLESRQFASVDLVPETSLVQTQAECWTLLLDDAVAILKMPDGLGYGMDSANMALLLQAQAEKTDGDQCIACYDMRSSPPELPDIDGITWRLHDLPSTDSQSAWLTLLFQSAMEAEPATSSFLSGEYAIVQPVAGYRRNWSIAAVFSGIALVVYLLAGSVSNMQLSDLRDRIDGDMSTLYSELFPAEQNVSRPYSELQSKLIAIKQAGGGDSSQFLAFLTASGKHLTTLPRGSVESLRFRNGTLEFDVKATSVEMIEQLQSAIQAESLKVELKAITTQGAEVRGRLLVSGKEKA